MKRAVGGSAHRRPFASGAVCIFCGKPARIARNRTNRCEEHARRGGKETQSQMYARQKRAAIKRFGSWAAYKRHERRARAKREGRELRNGGGYTSRTFDQAQTRLAQINARQAWQWWLKHAPDKWMRAYYRSSGKPWNNPRLSNAQQWKIRYWCDAKFRSREIDKVQKIKVKRAGLIESNSDGTLTGEIIVALYAAARICPYCHRSMPSSQKSLDHVVALTRGGAHSIENVVVVCKTCNTRKGRKDLTPALLEDLSRLCDPRFFPGGPPSAGDGERGGALARLF